VYVRLLTHTPDPERTVAAAARLCYSATGAARLYEDLSVEQVDKLLAHLIESGHESPTEHVTFTFAIEGVSRSLSHQLVRHRIASYSQQSQRYVREQSFDYIIPPSVAADPALKERFHTTMATIQNAYNELLKAVPAEDARYVLPNACETKLLCVRRCGGWRRVSLLWRAPAARRRGFAMRGVFPAAVPPLQVIAEARVA
jgi:thymidylate synthase (FAD)